VAREYAEAGLGELVALPAAVAGAEPAWHLYVVRSAHAEALEAALNAAGIGARRYYTVPVHRQPAMAGVAPGLELPMTDELARTNLALPMSPALQADQVAEVVASVRACASGST
jgi:dTDP-4-amino-4,6-dideoxygalactose transaminase